MFMISNYLVINRRNAHLYYHIDRLWKKVETILAKQISHDILENNRLSIKTEKIYHLLSTTYVNN